jgi:hypothetical protein
VYLAAVLEYLSAEILEVQARALLWRALHSLCCMQCEVIAAMLVHIDTSLNPHDFLVLFFLSRSIGLSLCLYTFLVRLLA